MKWTYGFQNKLTASIVLGLVFLLILFTTFSNNRNFSSLNESFETIYEDRLIAESFLFKLSSLIHQKQEMQLNGERSKNIQQQLKLDQEIQVLLSKYSRTKLTSKEENLFNALQVELNKMLSGNQLLASVVKIENYLHLLSEIQVTEGARIKEETKVVFLGNDLSSKFQFAMLIILAVIIQAIVFASKTINLSSVQQQQLN
ncbi:MCP four helix bundle domain-containing protein [Sediminibacterium sp.]|uniref:MCP four helix bundle domain-containing protein n=1 Tax=Sediminibacterium sp. TaxID=1917865 RepID=UPI003F6E92CA